MLEKALIPVIVNIKKISDRLFGKASDPRLLYVSEGSGWVLDWIAGYVKERVQSGHGLPCDVTSHKPDVDQARNRLIHFGSRYMLLKYPEWDLNKSNRVVLTWYHGEFESKDPEMQKQFASLKIAEPRIDKITTSCRASLRSLIQAGIPGEKIEVIPIGVQVSQFTVASPGQKAEMRRHLKIPENAYCVGSFQKDGEGWGEGMNPKMVKGPDVFVDTMRRLNQQVDHLVVLLTGYSRGYVKSRLDEMGIRYVHQYLEDYTKISAYYHALDAYLIASRCEGGPVSLMESWASGVPVVSTDMGMPADYIRHGENGLLSRVEDVAGLTENILTLKSNHALASQMIQNGLKDVQCLDWARVAEKYWERLYQPLLTDMKGENKGR